MLCRKINVNIVSYKVARRYKSHYLSNKWLKEPFSIGYPTKSKKNEEAHQALLEKLFPEKNLTSYDIYLQDKSQHNINLEWDKLDFEDRNKYEQIAVSQSPRYIHPKPIPLRGYELFKAQTQLKTEHYARKQWLDLPEEYRSYFTSSSNLPFLDQQRERIWKGYEIVGYLKRYSSEHSWNPYPLSNLYPWEIIKDKLRSKKKIDEFELDYYDVLIHEAFFRNYQRKAMHIFYTDLQHSEPGKYNYQQVLYKFNGLSKTKRQYYYYKQSLREKHALRTKVRIKDPGFRYFASKFISNAIKPEDIVADITQSWESLSTEDKETYANMPHRLEREYYLDWKLAIVMDYIYYTGQVVGLNYQYDWRKDMKEKTNGFVYIQGMYTEYVI